VAVLLVVLAAGGVAHAQGTGSATLPNGATIAFEHLKIVRDKSFFEATPGTPEMLHYFNLAHCNCAAQTASSTPGPTPGAFTYHVRETAMSGVHFGADFWAGTSCENATNRTGGSTPTCIKLSPTVQNIDGDLFPGGDDITFNLAQVVNGTITPPDGSFCQQLDNANNQVYLLADTAAGSTNYDFAQGQVVGNVGTPTTTVSGTDTKPPPGPANLTARTNENEIDLSWTPSSGNNTDVAYYQALCAAADGVTRALSSRTSNPQYVTTQATCPPITTPPIELPVDVQLDNGEAAATLVDGSAFQSLDASYICGETNSGTATSLQIKHLQNDVPYQVILVAVDLHGNFAALHFDHTITPHLVTDFWEDLHDNGSQTEGGLCLLAETYGNDSPLTRALRAFRDDTLGGSQAGRWLTRTYYATLARLGAQVHGSLALRALSAVVLAPVVAFALLWHWLGLPIVLGLLAAAWWLRRRVRAGGPRASWLARPRRWLGVATTVALIVLAAAPAHAGNGGYQPYWEDTDPTRTEQDQLPPDDPSLIKWHAGIRVGPYTPDIDNQENKHPGSFEKMFGTTQHLMTMLDLDYILWTGFGQIGVGGSLGYWQKTASAFATVNGMTTTMRAGAHNALHLVPAALTATYRFTWLDDAYGIPVVPYVRGGLSYYVWWASINDHFSRLCDGAGENCHNKALGASLGVQGSIGLSIRAERIDSSAAMSMRESGIRHAGIYGELSLAKVDGFGSDTKLAVGDRTWFAGAEFEF
jgi:hypothetical protein